MGRSFYGALSGTMDWGGFITAGGLLDKVAAAAVKTTLVSAGHTLLVATSSSLAAPTGTVAGTMASGTVATLSASYIAVSGTGL